MARRSVVEELSRDQVVEIPKQQERRFGGAGKMLKPSRASVAALVEKIPPGKVLTTSLLRQTLAAQHKVQTTCPFLTKRALLAIAEDPGTMAPFWRVVMADGELQTAYPGGGARQAKQLIAEGVSIAGGAGKHRVANLRDSLADI